MSKSKEKKIVCVLIQGYYFAKPMPVGEFEQIAFEEDERKVGGRNDG